MTQRAFDLYSAARRDQAVHNEARHIRTKINDARGNPNDAAMRWPFELLQNALDAGPRANHRQVEVGFTHEDGALVFEHDGAYFHARDLAALLSGGSNKEFEGAKTTGRFGTGFLVTHVLAPNVRLEGLLADGDQVERFDLMLDRQGDEAAIIRNIEDCNNAIMRADPIKTAEGVASARFTYPAAGDDGTSLAEGMRAFRLALPWLFATCPQLGCARLHLPGQLTEIWEATDPVATPRAGVVVDERTVRIVGTDRHLRVLRVTAAEQRAAVVMVLEEVDSRWRALLPQPEFPRVFCRYPIRTSNSLQINLVLDANFDLDQERRKILFGKAAVRALFHECLTLIVPLVEIAYEEAWELRHLLTRVGKSPGGPQEDKADRDFIDRELHQLAEGLAKLKTVETPRGLLPAISAAHGESHADFIDPQLAKKLAAPDAYFERVWGLVADAENLDPPKAEIACDWSEIAIGWKELGADVSIVTIDGLLRQVRGAVAQLDGLQVRCDRRDWLARFLTVVGERWTQQNAVTKSQLEAIIPNQHGRLAPGPELRREKEIADELKDIAEAVGVDVRATLVDRQLGEILARPEHSFGLKALIEVTPSELAEEEVVHECIAQLKVSLPEDQLLGEAGAPVVVAAIRLLDYLWRARGADAGRLAKEVPLLTRDGKATRATSQRALAPVSTWAPGCAAFSAIYPPNRVLADVYSGGEARAPNVIGALAAWGMVYPGLLMTQSSGSLELKVDRVKHLLAKDIDISGLEIPPVDLSQIALLHEVLPRCAEDLGLAKLLLGLVLTYIAPNDPSWQDTRSIKARRGKDEVEIDLRPALWLADLRRQAWVPVHGEGERRVIAPDHHALRPLLSPEWLCQNEAAIHLLTRFFGFNALDLQLVGVSADDAVKERISDDLARMVSLLGADVTRYGELVALLEERERCRRQGERFQKLGRAVQDAVEDALRAIPLAVRVIDKGFDFEVSYTGFEDGACQFMVQSTLIEVKATTTDRVRMTSLQASTAAREANRYVLCVMDLRGLSEARLDQPWSREDVLRLARLTTDVGSRVRSTWQLVEQAREGTVRISGEDSLRYEVPAAVWDPGCKIHEWVLTTWGSAPRDPVAQEGGEA
jgi:hypothetical protein